jgi:DNA repair protein RAD5
MNLWDMLSELVRPRYTFPPKPDGQFIDLTKDEKLFYLNPYSGEMSLKFPRSERNCKGGILALVVFLFLLC